MRPVRRLTLVAALWALGGARALAQEPAPPPTLESLQRQLEEQRAELERLAMPDESAHEAPLRLYGFMDMGVNKLFLPADASGNIVVPSRATTFVLGNVNVYLDAQPQKDWSGLIEVRLTNYPDGQSIADFPGQPMPATDTTIFDSNAPNPYTQIRWGAIVLERAYLQWAPRDAVQLRVGWFLTPFGIWNIDHGTPTLISLLLPQFEVNQLFPTHQLGLEALGSALWGEWRLGYFAYVSNGRTVGQLDPTEDKMLGGRLYAARLGRTRLTLGASGFTGRYADLHRALVGFDPPRVQIDERVAYQEHGVGADLSLDMGGLRLRAEVAHRLVRYDAGKRPSIWNIPNTFAADNTETSAYVVAAYHLPRWPVEPYVYVEPYRWPTPLGDGILMLSGGLNLYFGSSVQLKLQYAREIFMDAWASLKVRTVEAGTHFVLARAVLAF